ncbi:hypothetical protein JTB14_010040 [Gonioctena quinquepunctata]|nr:hypothetical protein JTB14_010040 [Gonioctena quinquepunctata]
MDFEEEVLLLVAANEEEQLVLQHHRNRSETFFDVCHFALRYAFQLAIERDCQYLTATAYWNANHTALNSDMARGVCNDIFDRTCHRELHRYRHRSYVTRP